MRISAAVAALALTLLSVDAHAKGPSVRWVTNGSAKDIQFGEPETDNRLLRLRCLSAGMIELSGPLPAGEDEDVTEGQAFNVSIKASGLTREVSAKAEERGDGFNFIAIVKPTHQAVVSLLGNNQVDIFRGKIGYEVPGKGAGRVVKSLIDACK